MTHSVDPAAPLIAVAMSGGVDSAIAALLLVRQGYRVVGLTLALLPPETNPDPALRGCCNLDAVTEAKRVCAKLEIPHYTLQAVEAFERLVIGDFTSELAAGRTPNPCVRCNTHLKWGTLWERARQIGATGMATGHYARISHEMDGPALLRGRDGNKDQSYFLWAVPYNLLDITQFPLGEMTKPEVRRMAQEEGFTVARRPESQDICFLGKGQLESFLERHGLEGSLEPGPILDVAGKRIGTHRGLARYTVGQRQGLGVARRERWYVLELRPEENALVFGPASHLLKSGAVLQSVNRLGPLEGDLTACLRYRHPGVPAVVETGEKEWIVRFREPQPGISPGQSLVLYRGDRVVGGGIIARAL